MGLDPLDNLLDADLHSERVVYKAVKGPTRLLRLWASFKAHVLTFELCLKRLERLLSRGDFLLGIGKGSGQGLGEESKGSLFKDQLAAYKIPGLKESPLKRGVHYAQVYAR